MMNMLESSRVRLRPLERADLKRTLEWVNDLDTAIGVNRVLPVTVLEHEEWYQRVVRDKTIVLFAVERKVGKKHIGNCGLRDIDWRSRSGQLWIYLDQEHVGKKLGTEAIQLLTEYGFNFLNLNRIYLYTLERNKRALKAYAKVGFRVEGRSREAAFVEGKYHDSIWMALLRNDRKQRR
jgi:RimJ/RimL family protein N-acetyltransferase